MLSLLNNILVHKRTFKSVIVGPRLKIIADFVYAGNWASKKFAKPEEKIKVADLVLIFSILKLVSEYHKKYWFVVCIINNHQFIQ